MKMVLIPVAYDVTYFLEFVKLMALNASET